MSVVETAQVAGVVVTILAVMAGALWALAKLVFRPNEQVASALEGINQRIKDLDESQLNRTRALWTEVKEKDDKIDLVDKAQTRALSEYRLEAHKQFVAKEDFTQAMDKLDKKVDTLQQSENQNGQTLSALNSTVQAMAAQLTKIQHQLGSR